MPTIYRAEIETRAFHFEAFGVTADEARASLDRGLEKHAAQHNLDPAWRDGLEMRVMPFTLGACYRDREVI
jgi:hypothetical protein